ncbi:hypothetical protein V6N11_076776 [Hibiscus sabdariffa]|uniref:Uncharacterized protein n=1 Tax=Hibiscus sabdariffa TaxID=183260 RepID=A0ABR2P9U6_9ROSI
MRKYLGNVGLHGVQAIVHGMNLVSHSRRWMFCWCRRPSIPPKENAPIGWRDSVGRNDMRCTRGSSKEAHRIQTPRIQRIH